MRSGFTLCPTKIVPSGSIGSALFGGGAEVAAADPAVASGFALDLDPFLEPFVDPFPDALVPFLDSGFGSAAGATVASASADTPADFVLTDLLARFAIAPHPS
ncbi:hypothetical protein [Pseudorhodoplanes sp.]|uniref:hypothetical protein n=1 Tax=Pseudorhodoplanes sp. TaxID=1934341 RepID=UPI002C2A019B|nr:hypothetical protein [Pseudorhodoplanes sp.]HWV55063.1 hypothetical protein [Pseudorhodoplanes sp.]